MSRNLNDLAPTFRERVGPLLLAVDARGVTMRPYYTIRTPIEQAKLWRQSRAKDEIQREIKRLLSIGAPYLAFCLESVGPQFGNPVTNAVPGYSWHQWGEAVDCFWQVDGRSIWSTTTPINGVNGYHVYTEEAKKAGLNAGGLWRNFKDWPHVQLRQESHPGKIYDAQEIDRVMYERFG